MRKYHGSRIEFLWLSFRKILRFIILNFISISVPSECTTTFNAIQNKYRCPLGDSQGFDLLYNSSAGQQKVTLIVLLYVYKSLKHSDFNTPIDCMFDSDQTFCSLSINVKAKYNCSSKSMICMGKSKFQSAISKQHRH